MAEHGEAVHLIRSTPLIAREDGAAAAEVAMRRGWFNGPMECAQALAKMTGGQERIGLAFGRPWPWIEVGEALLSPGLPVLTTPIESRGPDAVYRRAGDTVFREAGGREEALLVTTAPPSTLGEAFDALWFDDTARFLLRKSVIEIEDLFSRMVVPACRAAIEKILVRQRRCDPEIFEYIPTHENPGGRVTMEVARARAVTAPSWNDLEAFFRQGVGFNEVEISGDRLRTRGQNRPTIEFSFETEATGWRVVAGEQDFPFEELAAQAVGGYVIVTGTLSPEINPLATGMRERLAFDLRSFLVSL